MIRPEELVGTDISDRLRLGDFRGSGHLGWVFAAEILALGRPVGKCAAKLVLPRPAEDPEQVLEKLRAAARRAHPKLIASQATGLVRTGPAAGHLYLTMELGDQSLQELFNSGKALPEDDVLEMLRSVTSALAGLHEEGASHGEVRPTNILRVGKEWKLVGTELREIESRLQELEPTDHLFVFRAPETFGQESSSPPGDLWSLAVVAHASLTRRVPFQESPGLSRGDMIWRIMNKEPEPEKLSEPFHSVVRGCLRREPEARWTAARVLQCLDGQLPQEEPESEPERVRERERNPGTATVRNEPARPLLQPPPELEARIGMSAAPAPSADAGKRRPPFKPAVLGGLLLVLGLGMLIGLWRSQEPVRPVPNVAPDALYPVQYDVVRLDVKGRIEATERVESLAFSEDLGPSARLELVKLPGGSVPVGSPPDEPLRGTDESPIHQVTLGPFFMSRYEITYDQWKQVAAMPAERIPLPLELPGSRGHLYPAAGVSYDEAIEFCARLHRFTGRVYRLPTEAEWEYACRAGTTTPFHFGPTLVAEVANFRASEPYGQAPRGRDRLQPTEVGSFGAANGFGLFDMHGNVWEWCEDYYGPYEPQPQENPIGALSGTNRVIRGGSWQGFAWACRSGARGNAPPGERQVNRGFRVVVPETTIFRRL